MNSRVLLIVLFAALVLLPACGQQAPEGDGEQAVVQESPPAADGAVRQAIGAVAPGRPYTPAVRIGDTLYVSGQVAINPETGEEVHGSVEEETEQVMRNIERLVTEAGFEMPDVVRATVFLVDIDDYAAMNGVYGRYLPENPPARACVAVKEIVLGFKVEISCVAQR